MAAGFIYGLFDPRESLVDANCRYIGQTIKRPRERLWGHVGQARCEKDQTHRAKWIRKLLAADVRPFLVVLEVVTDDTTLDDREIAWIAWGRSEGWRLTNITDGGSVPVMTEETKAKISIANSGRQWTDEQRQRASLAQKNSLRPPLSDDARRRMGHQRGIPHTEETKAKISKGHTGLKWSDESRQRASDARKGKPGRVWTDEQKAANSARQIGHEVRPETREKLRQANLGKKHTDAAKSNMSKAQKGRKHSEETKQKIADAGRKRILSDEARANMSAGQRRRAERERAEKRNEGREQ